MNATRPGAGAGGIPQHFRDGLTAEQEREMLRWVNALKLPEEARRVALAIASLAGWACEDAGPQRLYRSEIAALVPWLDLPRQSLRALARISRWTTWLDKRGYLRKVPDDSECPRDDTGRIISHKGTFCWYELVRSPAPDEEPPEPAPREKRDKGQEAARGVRCPKCGDAADALTYKCRRFGCGHVFTAQEARAADAKRERCARSPMHVVPEPEPEPQSYSAECGEPPARAGSPAGGRGPGLPSPDGSCEADTPPEAGASPSLAVELRERSERRASEAALAAGEAVPMPQPQRPTLQVQPSGKVYFIGPRCPLDHAPGVRCWACGDIPDDDLPAP